MLAQVHTLDAARIVAKLAAARGKLGTTILNDPMPSARLKAVYEILDDLARDIPAGRYDVKDSS